MSQIEALGLTAESEGVVWDESGNLIELTFSDPLIETISLAHAHSLEKLDLTGCESLTPLDCGSDWNLRELTISGCRYLAELDCFDAGELRSLDLSECFSLQWLNCSGAGITELDVSRCASSLELSVDYSLQSLTIGSDASLSFRARKNVYRWDSVRAIDAAGNELPIGSEIRDWTHYERLIPIAVAPEASDPIAISYFRGNLQVGETTITRARSLDAPAVSASTTKTAMVVKISPVAGATSYVLEYSPNSDFSNARAKTYASSGVKTVSGLEFGSTVYVRVKATADSRDDSPWTETIVTVGAVATPVLREVGAASASVSLSISNVDKAIGYAIEYSTSEDFANSTIVNYPSYGTKTISGLEPSSVYYFRAIARGDGENRVDSLWSAPLSVETEAPVLDLDAPQIAGSVTKSALVVKINPVEGATSYVLEYGESADFSDATRRTYKTTGAKTISNLEFGSIYCVRVKAVGTPGVESDWSRIVLAVGGLAQPTLTVASASDVSVDVSFAKVANAAGYVVESSKLDDFSDAVAVQFPSSGTKTISGLDPSACSIRFRSATYLSAAIWTFPSSSTYCPIFIFAADSPSTSCSFLLINRPNASTFKSIAFWAFVRTRSTPFSFALISFAIAPTSTTSLASVLISIDFCSSLFARVVKRVFALHHLRISSARF